MCAAGYNLTFGQCVGATRFPTRRPTLNPTVIPSLSPSQKFLPTAAPTTAPTVAPTFLPIVLPTLNPAQAPTFAPTVIPIQAPTFAPTVVPTISPTSAPTFVSTVAPTVEIGNSDKIRVTTIFGTGRAVTTDSTGLIGEINTPIDNVFDLTQSYLYLTDQNGGGLIRKLSVTSSTAFTQIYAVKTVFIGIILIIVNRDQILSLQV